MNARLSNRSHERSDWICLQLNRATDLAGIDLGRESEAKEWADISDDRINNTRARGQMQKFRSGKRRLDRAYSVMHADPMPSK